jgi:hypothetical protein
LITKITIYDTTALYSTDSVTLIICLIFYSNVSNLYILINFKKKDTMLKILFSLLLVVSLLATNTIFSQRVVFAAVNMAMQNESGMRGMMIPNNEKKNNMIERGNIAMGFNQNKIIHHFIATPTGGEIMIVALKSSDNDTTKQIKNHVLDIQREFSKGNFTKPFFIHAQQVPGTKMMTEKKDLIKYGIKQTSNGSALLITSNDQQLIEAIHQFIAFQTGQHQGH